MDDNPMDEQKMRRAPETEISLGLIIVDLSKCVGWTGRRIDVVHFSDRKQGKLTVQTHTEKHVLC